MVFVSFFFSWQMPRHMLLEIAPGSRRLEIFLIRVRRGRPLTGGGGGRERERIMDGEVREKTVAVLESTVQREWEWFEEAEDGDGRIIQ